MSSMITLGSLKRITAPKLAEQLLARSEAGAAAGDSSIAIVDVRDDGKQRLISHLQLLKFFQVN